MKVNQCREKRDILVEQFQRKDSQQDPLNKRVAVLFGAKYIRSCLRLFYYPTKQQRQPSYTKFDYSFLYTLVHLHLLCASAKLISRSPSSPLVQPHSDIFLPGLSGSLAYHFASFDYLPFLTGESYFKSFFNGHGRKKEK